MKKILMLAATVLIGSLVSTTAALYEDINSYGLLGRQVTTERALVDSFNIAFDTAGEEAVWGEAVFLLADADKAQEEFSIQLGGIERLDSGKIDDATAFGITFELAGGGVASLLGDINADGILNYTISATSGNFNVLWARLVVSTDQSGSQSGSRVPDGGLTLALLGTSLLGLYAFRRKM